jgi:hypothetical protein
MGTAQEQWHIVAPAAAGLLRFASVVDEDTTRRRKETRAGCHGQVPVDMTVSSGKPGHARGAVLPVPENRDRTTLGRILHGHTSTSSRAAHGTRRKKAGGGRPEAGVPLSGIDVRLTPRWHPASLTKHAEARVLCVVRRPYRTALAWFSTTRMASAWHPSPQAPNKLGLLRFAPTSWVCCASRRLRRLAALRVASR